jgi:hypothetical protein
VKSARDPALEQRPHVLNAIGVDIPTHIVHGTIRELRAIELPIRKKLIGMTLAIGSDVHTDEAGQGFPRSRSQALSYGLCLMFSAHPDDRNAIGGSTSA